MYQIMTVTMVVGRPCVLAACCMLLLATSMSVTAQEDMMLTCNSLDVRRNYEGLGADGAYRLTNRVCPGIAGRFYKRHTDQSTFFLYRLSTGQWALFTEPCSDAHYGQTGESSLQPWTDNFINTGGSVTSISCLDYSIGFTQPALSDTGNLSLPQLDPNQETIRVQWDIQLPFWTESVNFAITTQMPCHTGSVEIDFTGPIDVCAQPGTSSEFVAFEQGSETMVTVVASLDRRGNMEDDPGLEIIYSISPSLHGGQPSTTITQPLVTTDEITTDGDYGSGQVDNTKEMTTAIFAETGSGDVEITPDPCQGIGCYFGSKCVNGECVCPTSVCSHIYAPVCASDGITYSSRCALDGHVCQHLKTIKVVHEGPCPVVKDPCDEVTCQYGSVCRLGKCECPEHTCRAVEDSVQVCASDNLTYTSQCWMEAASCLLQKEIVIRYKKPCHQPKPPVISESSDSTDSGIDEVAIVVCGFIGIIAIVAVVAFAVLCSRDRRRNPPLPVYHKEDKRPLAPALSRSSGRTLSTASDNFRASPKAYRHSSVKDKDIDPDRFSLTGCITPLQEVPDNPFFTFKPDHPQSNGTVNASPEKQTKPGGEPQKDHDSGIVEGNGGPEQAPGVKRENPIRRQLSSTDNSVYEISPTALISFDIPPFGDDFEDDANDTTRL